MTTPCVLGTPGSNITRYLWVDYIDIVEHSNLRELLFPDSTPTGIFTEVGQARYAVPESHPNITFIIATLAGKRMMWTNLAESNDDVGTTRIFI